jgi:hypothetical protein
MAKGRNHTKPADWVMLMLSLEMGHAPTFGEGKMGGRKGRDAAGWVLALGVLRQGEVRM